MTPVQNVSWIVYGEKQKIGSVIKRQASQATSDYEWLQITTSDYQSSYEWLQLRLVVTLGIKTLWIHNVSCDYTTANVVNTLKSILKIVALHFWWKSLTNEILIRLWNLMVFFCGTLKRPNSLNSFQTIISLLVTILICLKAEIYRHLVYMYYTLSSIICPHNACIHSALVTNIFIFQQKHFLVSLASKVHSFVCPTDHSTCIS